MSGPGSSYAQNERIAREAENRRGRLVGGNGDDTTAFASGEAVCARCGVTEDAGRMMRSGVGIVCENCFLVEDDAPPSAARSWWLRAAAALASGLIAAAGATTQLAVFGLAATERGVTAPPESGLPWGLAMAGLVFAGLAVVMGVPLLRALRLDPDLSGLSVGSTRGVAVVGGLALVLGALAMVMDAGLMLFVL